VKDNPVQTVEMFGVAATNHHDAQRPFRRRGNLQRTRPPTAREITDRMSAEVRELRILQKANDGEKATLRLETDKLRGRRPTGRVLVHVLDQSLP